MGHDADGHEEHGRALDRVLDPAFDRHVLDQLPTPIVVVDQLGTIVYGNASMARTMRLTLDEARGCCTSTSTGSSPSTTNTGTRRATTCCITLVD